MRLPVLTAFLALATIAPTAATASPPILPNPKLTPGAVLPVSAVEFCVPGYSKKVRSVPERVKRQVYAEYGITHHGRGEFEVDHLISLELGGSNSIKNLWPQSYKTSPWNARVKDALEDRLHAMVCSGELPLEIAQHEIATNWIAAYKKYVGDTPAAGRKGRSRRRVKQVTTTTTTTAKPRQVWVNLGSGKFFQPGSRWYGKTKKGQYMSEADALKAGYVAAGP